MNEPRTGRPRLDADLLLSNSRRTIITIGTVYLAWHFVATLTWPRIFSPSLWACTLIMAGACGLALYLLPRYFALGQAAWFFGLALTVLVSYRLYHSSAIPLLLVLLPLMAALMIGLRGALLVETCLLLLTALWGRIDYLPALGAVVSIALPPLSLAMLFLGWSLSSNLISAIDAASHHYRQAVEHLNEARRQRAEISTLNRELSKSNFQMERLNRMLSAAYAQAEEAREERDRFAMSVSHELRSPLNFIIGFSDLMANAPETYAPLADWPTGLYDDAQEIYRSSAHLHSLIDDILDMGKIDARQMALFREKAQLGDIIETVRAMVEPEVTKKGLWLHVTVEPDLPALYIDRTRIRQVLINLVTNALRYTEQGGLSVRALRDGPDWVRVEVEDSGAGIAEADIPKVFNEFRQVGNENWRRKEGSGLGLAIGRRFIDLHRGRMGVESELGKGSCFYFTLPARPSSVTAYAPDGDRVTGNTASAGDETPAATVNADTFHHRPGDFAGFDPRHGAGDRSANLPHPLGGSAQTPAAVEREPLVLFLTSDLLGSRMFGDELAGYKVMLLSEPDQIGAVCGQFYPKAVLIDPSLLGTPAVRAFLANPPYDLPAIVLPLPAGTNPSAGSEAGTNLPAGEQLPEGVICHLRKPVARQDLQSAVLALGPNARRLLVVDDDPAMLRFVTQSLRSFAVMPGSRGEPSARTYDLLLADCGEQALEQICDVPLDGILLDLELPDMNGLELLAQIRAKGVCPPVIILSANDLPETLSPRQPAALEVRVSRPFARQELADIITAILGQAATHYKG